MQVVYMYDVLIIVPGVRECDYGTVLISRHLDFFEYNF